MSYLSTGRWPRQAGIPTSLSSCAPAIGRRVPKHLFSLSIIRGSVAGVRGGSRTQRRQAFAPNRRTRGPALAWARGAALHMSWASNCIPTTACTYSVSSTRCSRTRRRHHNSPCPCRCGRRGRTRRRACRTSNTCTTCSRTRRRRRSSCGACPGRSRTRTCSKYSGDRLQCSEYWVAEEKLKSRQLRSPHILITRIKADR